MDNVMPLPRPESPRPNIINSPLFVKPEQYRQDRGPGYVPWAR